MVGVVVEGRWRDAGERPGQSEAVAYTLQTGNFRNKFPVFGPAIRKNVMSYLSERSSCCAA